MTDDRPTTARLLDLEQHPEGGWFRRMWTGTYAVDTPAGERPAATLIHYLLTPGEHSAWHVVTSDEVWLWHGPGRLELSFGSSLLPAGAAESAYQVACGVQVFTNVNGAPLNVNATGLRLHPQAAVRLQTICTARYVPAGLQPRS